LPAQLDVLEGEGSDAGQVLGQCQVAGFVLADAVGIADGQRAQDAVARADGNDDQRAQLRIVQRARGPLG
jgi:hypothetical protein